jgi:hypothetical protein
MVQKLITWEALEFVPYERTSDWYWILGIVAIVGFIISLFLKNILLAIFILIGAFTIYLYAKKEPQSLIFSLTDQGVQIGTTLHPYAKFESFWVDASAEDFPMLRLMPERTLALPMTIPLGDADQSILREILSEQLDEEEQFPGIVEHAIDILRF